MEGSNRILLIFINTIIFIIAAFALVSCNDIHKTKSTNNQSITIYAASSMTDVLSEIVDSFSKEFLVDVRFNFASSGTLASQIIQGAEADLFISANKKWTYYLDSLGLIKLIDSSFISNQLVLIAPKRKALKKLELINAEMLDSIIGNERLVISNPSHVPAGQYAAEVLSNIGFIVDGNNVLKTKDVRSTLMLIELGEFPLGIVYLTDAMRSKKVDILHLFSIDLHSPIEYNMSVCSNNPSSKEFVKFANSTKVKSIWHKFGFSTFAI